MLIEKIEIIEVKKKFEQTRKKFTDDNFKKFKNIFDLWGNIIRKDSKTRLIRDEEKFFVIIHNRKYEFKHN